DDSGNVVKAGEVLPLNCVSWFGLEGQFEPKDAANNPGGAPMELYLGNMWWANSGAGTGRTIEQTMQEIVAQGVNLIRVPIAPQTLDATNEQGIGDVQAGGVLKNHEDVRQLNSRQALTDFIIAADKYDLNVIIDIHSCSNYLGWRAGDLEASPPFVDADRQDYNYTREDYSCSFEGIGEGVTVQEYNEQLWKENLAEIAGLSKELGVDNILGVDIFNEPWNYTWAEWKTLAESAYETISAVNDDMLIVVEGVGSSLKDGTLVEHGSADYTPNWGENLYGFADAPLNIPKNRLILSPHTYGPSVFVQNHFLDKTQTECADLEGDAAGAAKCDIIIDATSLAKGWDEHFGYLREQGYAVLIGEFGGMMDWPLGADTYYQELWSHASTTVDKEWQTALVNYMDEKSIQGCYWSLNPESADTGGIYEHAHDAESNPAGWGEWKEMDPEKLSLLEKLWK
ncbi:glycoside hydrolase family 5 protein, partial [Psychromonas sp.]|nr:glycoside hydrolase family 5 protein [Psychromonas sp.]